MMGRGGTPQAFQVIVGRLRLLLNLRLNRAHIRALASSVPKYLDFGTPTPENLLHEVF